MSLSFTAEVITALGFPRVSGDEPKEAYLDKGVAEFSPRERG